MKMRHFIFITSLDTEELIKNAYKENKFAKDILAILYKREGRKVRY